MTETINRYGIYEADHAKFGGTIDIEDFNTNSPNKRRISNQAEADSLQKTLEVQKYQKKMEGKYKAMTLEELKEMRIVSNTTGRPTSDLTDEKWQKEFNIRKLFITPYAKNVKRLGRMHSKESGVWDEEKQGIYQGKTSWQEYCNYINDVLRNIRSGQVDYCYYIYQILDLLKFHYDSLHTKYYDGYWEVWLE